MATEKHIVKHTKQGNPKLTVVGAGPGDVELITLKAIKALQQANVVLYDALVDPELLAYAPHAEHIFVGKRKGCYTYQQAQINDLIVNRAQSHGHVVRLKGGDPFVFGRGGDELDYLSAFGIRTEIIPGISSSTSALSTIQAPLTKRGISEGFWVMTGTKEYEQFSHDIELASQSNSTVVILMGMSKLPKIVDLFIENGKADLPVAIIQSAYCHDQKSVTGRVNNIMTKVKDHGLKNPAVIVLGNVVRESPQWQEEVYQIINTRSYE